MRRLSPFWGVGLTLALVWLLLTWALPYATMWATGSRQPIALPGFAHAIYLALALIGCAVHVTSSDAAMREFARPLVGFLAGSAFGWRGARLARLAVLGAVPLAAGALVHSRVAPAASSPVRLRVQHPTMPETYAALANPFREPSDAAVQAWMTATAFRGSRDDARRALTQAALEEGRLIFQTNCRPCHGAAADGRGPMARGFTLKPADFTDPGTIATVVEAYAYWRATEGGPGLPPEATPWDSAMPAWKGDLTDAQRWKAVMAAYDLAGVEPRRVERPHPAPAAPPAVGTAGIDRGREIYAKRCLVCHGEKGDGEGPIAADLEPRPRNFVRGSFKLRTTASGDPPTDDDLFRVVTRGIPGTAMPGWPGLTDDERRRVIAYVKTFSDVFREPATPVKPSREVPASVEAIARGRDLYQTAKCWECHGQDGRGDGPAAATLEDSAGDFIAATNLTRGWRLKGGAEARDIFMRLSTGMDGTPMPSYAEAFDEEARWALAHYVRSLQTAEAPGTAVVLSAARVEGDLPRDPDDPRWQRAPRLAVPLAGQVLAAPRWQHPSVDTVTVRALHGGAAVAFLLEWDDPVKDTRHAPRAERPGAQRPADPSTYVRRDRSARGKEPLRDAVRVQFPAAMRPGQEPPQLLLGSAARPVTLWHWHADLDAAGRPSVVRETATGAERAVRVQPAVEPTPRGANSSDRSADEDLSGRGVWRDGRWKVVLTGRETVFAPGRLVPFAVQVWDGASGEHGLMLALSSWAFVRLEAPASPWTPLPALATVAVVALGEWWAVRRARRVRPVLSSPADHDGDPVDR